MELKRLGENGVPFAIILLIVLNGIETHFAFIPRKTVFPFNRTKWN